MQKAHEIPIESQALAFSPGGWLEAARTVVGKLPAYHGRVPQGPPRGVVETPRGQNGWILLGVLGISLVILEKKNMKHLCFGDFGDEIWSNRATLTWRFFLDFGEPLIS